MNIQIILDAIVPEKAGEKNWKARVPSKEVLGGVYETTLPDCNMTFNDLKNDLQQKTKAVYQQKKIKGTRRKLMPPKTDAFKNCNGRWLEYIFAVYAWNALVDLNQGQNEYVFIYAKLPNNTKAEVPGQEERVALSWTSILDAKHQKRIEYKKSELLDGENTKLEASNPDAVILRLPRDGCVGMPDPCRKIENIGLETQKAIDSVFTACKEKICTLDQLVAFISIKASTRSDRRYQFILEGNSTKGLYATAFSRESPLKVGELMKNKYFAFSLEAAKEADHEALDGLIMFASLFNEAVGSTHAIDALYDCETPTQVVEKIKSICNTYR